MSFTNRNPNKTATNDKTTKLQYENFERLRSEGIRIFKSAGNKGKNAIAHDLFAPIEGVGAFNHSGKVAEFSSTRNSSHTQHYELGEFAPQKVYDNGKLIGYNITGTDGVDIPIDRIKEACNKRKELYSRALNIDEEIALIEEKQNKLHSQIQLEAKKVAKEKGGTGNIKEEEALVSKFIEKYESEFNFLYTQKEECMRIKKVLDHIMKYYKDSNLDNTIKDIYGTSFATPTRTAKVALNDMMKGIL